jgi:hypothetical protein
MLPTDATTAFSGGLAATGGAAATTTGLLTTAGAAGALTRGARIVGAENARFVPPRGAIDETDKETGGFVGANGTLLTTTSVWTVGEAAIGEVGTGSTIVGAEKARCVPVRDATDEADKETGASTCWGTGGMAGATVAGAITSACLISAGAA